MKQNLRAASLLFNQPLLVTPEMLDIGVRWANSVMNLNIINVASSPQMMDQEAENAQHREDSERRAVNSTGVEVIPVSGILVSRGAHLNACEVMTSYEGLRAQLKAAVADPAVERIVLDIDSPGGAAVGAFELAADIRAMAKQKPITGLVNFMAYSGGYLIGSACSDLIVSQTSGVGSIGVIASHYDRSKAEEAAGVKITTVYAGAHKNDLSPHEPITEQSLQVLNDIVQESYQMFINAVAEYRGLTPQQVAATEAALYRGESAIRAGLADRLQSPQAAVDEISHAVALSRAGRGAGRIAVRAAAANIQSTL